MRGVEDSWKRWRMSIIFWSANSITIVAPSLKGVDSAGT